MRIRLARPAILALSVLFLLLAWILTRAPGRIGPARDGDGSEATTPASLRVKDGAEELAGGIATAHGEGLLSRQRGLASLAGRVRDESTGSPIPGAHITAVCLANDHDLRADTYSDAHGDYAFFGLHCGPWRAFAQESARATKGLSEARPNGFDPLAVVVTRGATATLDFDLVPGAVVTGQVLDADGTPAEGVSVTAIPTAWRTDWERQSRQTATSSAVTSVNGAFRLEGLAPGVEVILDATSADRLPISSQPLLPDPASANRVDLRLDPVRFVEVEVVDATSGEPIPAATVVAWYSHDTDRLSANALHWAAPWRADGLGRLKAGPFPVVPVRFAATPPGRIYAMDPQPVVPTDQASVVIRIPGGLLAGAAPSEMRPARPQRTWPVRVTDATGMLVPQAWLIAWDGGGWRATAVVDGEADGSLSEPRPADWIEVFDASDREDSPLALGAVRVRPGTSPPTDIRMPEEQVIAGHVVGPAGVAVQGALVIAFPDWWPDPNEPGRASGHGTARTDAAGAFRIGRLADIGYGLEVRPPPDLTAAPRTSVHAGSTDIVLHLGPTVSATITVTDDARTAIAGAFVTVQSQPLSPSEQDLRQTSGAVTRTTDEHGAVRIDHLDPTKDSVVQADPPLSRTDLLRAILPAWRGKDATLQLSRIWEIRGIVRDDRGDPVPGAQILLVSPQGGMQFGEQVARSGEDGRFVFKRATSSPITLRVTPLSGRAPRRDEGQIVIPGGPEAVLVTDRRDTTERKSGGR